MVGRLRVDYNHAIDFPPRTGPTMATVTLPPHLDRKLGQLATRFRRGRLVRGSGVVALTVVTGLGAALALDAALILPPAARFVLVGLFIISCVVAVALALVRPLRRPIDDCRLAAEVEREFPRLGERLLTTVELARSAQSHNGSASLIGELSRDTDLRTRPMDFTRADPQRVNGWLWAGLAATAVAIVVPALIWPDDVFGLGRRFVMPWDRRPAVPPFVMTVSPVGGAVAKGRPVTFRLELTPTRQGVVLPQTATLALNPDATNVARRRMERAGNGTYVLRLDAVESDLAYRVEAGPMTTETMALAAVEPVDLAGRPKVTLLAPSYAPSIAPQEIDALADVTLVQFGKLRHELLFTRPAVAVEAVWDAGDGVRTESMTLLDGGRRAVRDAVIGKSGRLSLRLLAEHGVATDLGPWQVTATPDRPPEFVRVAGVAESEQVAKPSDTVALDVAVRDDQGIAAVELEYRVNDGPAQAVPLPLTTPGARDASLATPFALLNKVKDGDRIRYRLKATDVRNLPSERLTPNVTFHPSDERWSELRVANDADALAKQEAKAQKELIERKLKDLTAQVGSVARLADKLKKESDGAAAVTDEHAQELTRLRTETKGATDATNELAKLAERIGLDPLAAGLKAIADDELRRAGDDVQSAAVAADGSRTASLRRAEEAVAQAREKLESLQNLNRDLAKAREDEAKLNDLANRERQLADEAAKASTPEDRDRVAREQDALAKELKGLAEQSDAVKEALKKFREEEAKWLATAADELAKKQRQLNETIKEQERAQVAKKLAEAAAKQKQLADDADRLSKKTKKPIAPPSAAVEAAENAAQYLKRGEPELAGRQQAKAAEQLDRLADDLKKAVEAEAARRAKSADELNKLRRQQDEFARKIGSQKSPADLARSAREQVELQMKFNQIDAAGQDARKEEARRALGRAQDDLRNGRSQDAVASQDDARRVLERFEEALRGVVPADEKAQELARRQKELADELAKVGDAAQRRTAADREEAIARDLQNLKATEAPVRQVDAIDAAIKALRLLRDKPDDPAINERMRDAADKAQLLADQLAKKETERERAERLAKEQANVEGDAAKKSEAELRRRANQIAEEAKQLRGGDQASAAKQALLDALAKQQKTPPQLPTPPQARHDVTEALRKLAGELDKNDDQAHANRTDKNEPSPDKAAIEPKVDRKSHAPGQTRLPTKEDAQKAKELAKEQRDLIEVVRKASAMPADPVPGETEAANKASQNELAKGAAGLEQQMRQQADALPNTPSGRQAEDAAKSTQEAQEAMREANNSKAAGKQRDASRNKAANALSRAAKQVGQNAPPPEPDAAPGGAESAAAGQSVRQAQSEMREGGQQYREGKTQEAKNSMEKAADALAKAAKALGQRQDNTPNLAREGNTPAPTGDLMKELKKHAGKAWGDLPGELKTRLLQEMKAQYGDDYARVIKLYFEQIAEAK